MSGIGVVLNPHSRSNRRNPKRAGRLSFIVGDRGSCHATQEIPDLTRVAEEFAERNVEILCISGGDGTIHHTITNFIKVYGDRPLPMIALLRGGTVNNVAGSLEIRGTPEDILSRLIVRYHENVPFDTVGVETLRVNDDYGFAFGNGLVANLIKAYKKMEFGGKYSIFLLMLRASLSCLLHSPYLLELAAPFDADLFADGVRWPYRNYCTVMAGTVKSFAVGLNPFPHAHDEPGRFEIIGLSAVPRKVLFQFARVWLRGAFDPECRLQALARDVRIVAPEPMDYMIDGEFYDGVREITLGCGPRLTMIRV